MTNRRVYWADEVDPLIDAVETASINADVALDGRLDTVEAALPTKENVGVAYSRAETDALLASQRPTSEASYLRSGGGVSLVSALTLRVSAANYYIAGVAYASPQTNVTLAAANATNARFDAIVVNTSGAVVVVTGTPSATPVLPDVDPLTQLALTYISVPANATVIPNVVQTDFYREATESTITVSAGGRIVSASTNNPLAGTKDIEGTAAVAADFVKMVLGAPVVVASSNQLVLNIRSKASWPNQKSLQIQFSNGATKVGQIVAVANNLFGFNSGQTSAYQQIIIPIGNFQLAAGATADTLQITVTGGGASIGFYLDNIYLESTTVITTSSPVPRASSTVSGTVRTTTNSADPQVYDKAAVDAAIAAAIAGVSAGAWTPLGTYSAAASSDLACATRNASGKSGELFQDDFEVYIAIGNIAPSGNGTQIYLEAATTGPVYHDGTGDPYESAWRGASSDGGEFISAGASGRQTLFESMSNAAGYGNGNFELWIYNTRDTTNRKDFSGKKQFGSSSPKDIGASGFITYKTVGTKLSGFRLLPSAGTVTGKIRVYGLNNPS